MSKPWPNNSSNVTPTDGNGDWFTSANPLPAGNYYYDAGSLSWLPFTSGGSVGTAAQGAPNTLANAWPVKITNGTYSLAVNSDGSINTATAATVTTAFSLNSAGTTNATSVKASAGVIYALNAFNNSDNVAYLKLYDKASAPTVGSDTPLGVIVIPAQSTYNVPMPTVGMKFATGIAYAITGGILDADTTAIAASQVKIWGSYA